MDIQDKVNLFMDTELNSYEYSLSECGVWKIETDFPTYPLYVRGKFVNIIRRACEVECFYSKTTKTFGYITKIEIEEV